MISFFSSFILNGSIFQFRWRASKFLIYHVVIHYCGTFLRQSDGLNRLIALYVGRSFSLWKIPEVRAVWCHVNVT